MRYAKLMYRPYELLLRGGEKRQGCHVCVMNDRGESALGDVAPLFGRSVESLQEAMEQLKWCAQKLQHQEIDESLLASLDLFPSVAFGIESALCTWNQSSSHKVNVSVLLLGSEMDILQEAALYAKQGYTTAKIKVQQLSIDAIQRIIEKLHRTFRLRIDANASWTKEELCRCCAGLEQYIEYIEDPLHDISQGSPYPFALDAHYAIKDLTHLRALVYKPMVRGGLSMARQIYALTQSLGIKFVLSSSFESRIGHAAIIALARRLKLQEPIGIGTLFHIVEERYIDQWL